MTAPRRWLEFANEDLILAEAALEKDIPNQACFHRSLLHPDPLPGRAARDWSRGIADAP